MPDIRRRETFYARGSRGPETLHIEVDGAIVNITVGLQDREGRQVTRVETIPDDQRRGGDGQGRMWQAFGDTVVRVIRHHDTDATTPTTETRTP